MNSSSIFLKWSSALKSTFRWASPIDLRSCLEYFKLIENTGSLNTMWQLGYFSDMILNFFTTLSIGSA